MKVPIWWWQLVFVGSVAMGMATNYTGNSELSWYVKTLSFNFIC